jgi:hypothetical protein
MRTRNCVVILLITALAGPATIGMQAGQDNPAQPQQTAQRRPSGTRSASCLVRITVDPAIVPLDPATVQGLLYSSGVAAKAARDVLQRFSMESPWEEIIEMEWLNESSPGGLGGERLPAYLDEMQKMPRRYPPAYEAIPGAQAPPAGSLNEETAAYDRQMMQELENIYGKEYMQQMGMSASKSRDRQNRPAGGSGGTMGIYGTRSRENPRAPLAPARSAPGAAQSATIRVSIHLPDGVLPAADEFLEAIVGNLKETLRHAYEDYVTALNGQLEQVRHQHDRDIDVLQGETGPETSAIKERLNRVVDLSALNPDMPIAEAVEILRRSVDPPLNIVVLWNDLTAFLSVERTTPINLDGMPIVRLGTALDLLVRGLPASDEQPTWRIKGDAIVIATAATFGESGESVGQANVEIDVQALAAQRSTLTNKLQELELSLAGQEARRRAIAEQIARAQAETKEKLANDDVMRELEGLIKLSEQNLSDLRKERASFPGELAEASQKLAMARIELAKRREELSKQVGGGQLEQLNAELSRMAIDRAEKEAQRGILNRQVAQIQQQLARASTFDPEAARGRTAKEGLDILARRMTELQVQIANLQPPMVTMIGAN